MLNVVGVSGKAVIQVFSTTNEFIDCVFLVQQGEKEEAKQALEKAFDEWFENEEAADVPYGEWLCIELGRAEGVTSYEVYYAGCNLETVTRKDCEEGLD